jgi:hypothetical protein
MRTTLAVDENIAKEFSKIVKEKNKVIFSVTNSSIQLATELLKDDIEIEDAILFWRLFKMMGMVDTLPIPGSLNETLLNRLYKHEKDALYKIFYETGKEIALKFKIYFNDLVSLLTLTGSLIKFFPLKKFEFTKLDVNKKKYKIVLVGAGQSIVATNCLVQFIKGFFEVYNAEIIKEEVTTGLVNMEFVVKSS